MIWICIYVLYIYLYAVGFEAGTSTGPHWPLLPVPNSRQGVPTSHAWNQLPKSDPVRLACLSETSSSIIKMLG